VHWLEQSYREGSLWSLGFPSDPILAQLRNDLHYRLFLSRSATLFLSITVRAWGSPADLATGV
jgi:hypothetical protein